GIEEARARAVVATDVEPKQTLALEEEGSLLGEKSLEAGEIDHRRIGFDLAEVGIDGRVDGEVGGDADLEIGSNPRVVSLLESRRARRVAGPGDGVGSQLHPSWRHDALDACHVAELRRDA